MSPDLARSHFLGWQERCEGALQNIRVTADSMRCVTVVGTLAVETQVVGRGHEECLQKLSIRQGVELCCHVEDTAGYGHRTPETQQPAAHNAHHCKVNDLGLSLYGRNTH